MASEQAAVVVVGTIAQDIVTTAPLLPTPGATVTGEAYVTSIGGRGAAQAIAFARMHHPVHLMGCVGKDTFGNDLLTELIREKVTTDYVKTVATEKTGMTLNMVSAAGAHASMFIPGANAALTPQYLDGTWKLNQPVLQALTIQLDLQIDVVVQAASLAKQQAAWVIAYGLPTATLPVELIRQMDFMILTGTEAAALSGLAAPGEALTFLVQHGVPQVIVTLQEQGTWYWDGTTAQHLPAHPAAVADPTGAADAFIAAFTSRLLTEPDMKKAVRYGNLAQMLAASRIGSHVALPLREEVDSLYQATSTHHLPAEPTTS